MYTRILILDVSVFRVFTYMPIDGVVNIKYQLLLNFQCNDNIVLEEEQFEAFGSKKNCFVVFRQISLNLLFIDSAVCYNVSSFEYIKLYEFLLRKN